MKTVEFRWWPVNGGRHAIPDVLDAGDSGQTLCGLPCTFTGRRQAGPPQYQSEVGLRALIQLPSCESAKRLAGSVMTLLAQDPPDDVAPQRPLLYRPDEPDMPR